MNQPATASRALIQFIAEHASRLGGAVSRIRLIKLLYLADVHWFQQRQQLATSYRWRFYHYGPYTAEAQRDIDECVARGLISAQTVPRPDETGDMTLYRATSSAPDLSSLFSATLEATLSSEIRRWLWAPLPEFLNYVYFDTRPMREARRGEYLRFEPELFYVAEPSPAKSGRRYTSREARQAFQQFITSREKDRFPVPRDAILDDAYLTALNALDAEDTPAHPLEGTVAVNPDDLSPA